MCVGNTTEFSFHTAMYIQGLEKMVSFHIDLHPNGIHIKNEKALL